MTGKNYVVHQTTTAATAGNGTSIVVPLGAWAALGAASAKDLIDAIRETGASQFVAALGGLGPALAGLVTATITAAISVKWLVSYLGRHTLELFGWWRIVVAGAFAWAIVMGWIARG